jgi:tellurite resistance protein
MEPDNPRGQLREVVQARREVIALGPVAAFLNVAVMDRGADEQKLALFAMHYTATRNALLQQVFFCSSSTLEDRVDQLVDDADLGMRALEALGEVFRDLEGGPEARATFLDVLAAVAAGDGAFTADERAMIQRVDQVFDGPPPPAPKAEALAALIGLTAAGCQGVLDGLIGSFLYTALADGVFQAEAIDRFVEALLSATSPLLRAAAGDFGGAVHVAARVTRLVDDNERCNVALRGLARVLGAVDGGRDAERELLQVLHGIAALDGPINDSEKAALYALSRQLSGDPMGGIAAYALVSVPESLLDALAHGPIAAMSQVLLASVASGIPAAEIRPVRDRVLAPTSSLGQAVLACSDTPVADRLTRVMEAAHSHDPFTATALEALAFVYQHVPGGEEARDELLEVLAELDGRRQEGLSSQVDHLRTVLSTPVPWT